MVHFLRNRLYKYTFCDEDKHKVDIATSHTLVTCPTCLDRLIEWKEKELAELKQRRAGIPNAKTRRKKQHEQTEIKFDEPVSVSQRKS